MAGYSLGGKGPPDPDAEIAAGRAELPGLKFVLLVPNKQYQLGEPIEVTLRYTYSGNRKLSVGTATRDRTGRLIRYSFSAVDKDGKVVRDPLNDVHTMGLGWGESMIAFGPDKPYEQKAAINECLAFDQPGKYFLTARSSTVRFDNFGTGEDGVPISLTSKPVEIEIIPFDEHQRVRNIAAAGEALKSEDGEKRRAAMEKLWFMMDQRAIPLMLACVNDRSG